ncbi:TPA: rubredoxin [Candidatus Gastranaerophilales bacterium HUM_20]|nr:glutamate synthase (NADPH) [Clostridium sp. CAG:729]DAB20649.1 MAG TPA: rubredoxin [Candidatus Gastranaerophilales bacterium HUM_20]
MRYKCDVCEWIFDEEKEDIKFEDLADDWTCPICGAAKDMFSKID